MEFRAAVRRTALEEGARFGVSANVVAGAVSSRSAHWAAPGSADLLHVHGCVADNTSLQAAGDAV